MDVETKTRTQTQRRLDPPSIEALIAAYDTGRSVKQLSESWQIHRTTVMAHLRRNNIKTRRNIRKMTDIQVAKAAELYQAGQSLAKLGRKYGVDPQTVAKELRLVGTTIRPRRGS